MGFVEELKGSKKGKKGKKRQKEFLPFFALLAFFASPLASRVQNVLVCAFPRTQRAAEITARLSEWPASEIPHPKA
jgi:hypothetical protein